MLMVGVPKSPRTRGGRDRNSTGLDDYNPNELFAAISFCHLSYILGGRPIVVPALCWRERDYIFVIASCPSRALKIRSPELDVCLTVFRDEREMLPSFALSRAENGRSVVVFGKADVVAGEQARLRILNTFLARLFLGPIGRIRCPNAKEFNAITILRLGFDDVSANLRLGRRGENIGDFGHSAWISEVYVASRTRKA